MDETGELPGQLLAGLGEAGGSLGGAATLVFELCGQAGRHRPGVRSAARCCAATSARSPCRSAVSVRFRAEASRQACLGRPRRGHLIGTDQEPHHHAQGDAGDKPDNDSGDHELSSSGATWPIGGQRTEGV